MADDEIDFSEIGKKIKDWFKPKESGSSKKSDSEDELNFGDAVKFLKEHKQLIFYAALASIILVGAWVRTLSVQNYDHTLLGLDPFVFYRYTELLVNNGYLPEVDTYRYFPSGFSTFKEQQMISYFVAGLYTLFQPLFGGALVDYSIMYPVIAFAISMVFLFLMVKEIFDKRTAIIATAFLAFIPSYLFRTIAGFADKEALATVFWFSMVYALVKSIRAGKLKNAVIYGLISGVLGGLSGLTWGGANFLNFSISLTFQILALMNRVSRKNIISFFAWYTPMILMNATMTLRYNGWGLIMQDMFLVPTLTAAVLAFKVVFDLFLKDLIKIKQVPDNFKFIVVLVILMAVILPIIQITGIMDIGAKLQGVHDTILHPFGTCPFCVSVTENQAPWFYDPSGVDWWHGLQWFIPLFVMGSALLVHDVLSKFGNKSMALIGLFLVFTLFFMFSKFVNDSSYAAANTFFASTYLLTLPLLLIGMVLFYVKFHKSSKWSELTPSKLMILLWFALSVIATRGAIRIVFASTPVFVIVAAYGVERVHVLVKGLTKDRVYSTIPYVVTA